MLGWDNAMGQESVSLSVNVLSSTAGFTWHLTSDGRRLLTIENIARTLQKRLHVL